MPSRRAPCLFLSIEVLQGVEEERVEREGGGGGGMWKRVQSQSFQPQGCSGQGFFLVDCFFLKQTCCGFFCIFFLI